MLPPILPSPISPICMAGFLSRRTPTGCSCAHVGFGVAGGVNSALQTDRHQQIAKVEVRLTFDISCPGQRSRPRGLGERQVCNGSVDRAQTVEQVTRVEADRDVVALNSRL